MTTGSTNPIEALLGRIDFLTNRGAVIMKAAAVFTWLGAVAATLAVWTVMGWPGWVIGVICLLPGAILWRYGDRLANAIDVEQIRGQLGEAADLAKTRLVEVVDGIQTTRRQPIRGGFRVLKIVRGLRSDLDQFGVDVAGIAEVGNPGSMLMAALSLGAGLGLWALAVVGILLRVVL